MTTSQFKRNQSTAPTAVSATAVAGGGTFAAGAQFWKISVYTPGQAESPGSNEVTATLALNGHADLVWTNPPGTTSVRIYRGTVTNTENTLVVQLSGNPTTYTDTNVSAGAATPPAATAFGNITKSGTLPLKSNIPAGTPSGLALAFYQAMCEWCSVGTATTAGTSPQARLGDELANAAGFDLQEV